MPHKPPKPRIHIRSSGVPGGDTTVTVVDDDGTETDITHYVLGVSWFMGSDGTADVTMTARAAAVDVLGDLSRVTVYGPPPQARFPDQSHRGTGQ
jgi:hypothetical protein